MNTRTYLIPGLKGVIVKTSDTECGVWFGSKGQGFVLDPVWPIQEIANRVKSFLWFNFDATEKEKSAVELAVFRVDWEAIKSQAGTDVQHTSPSLPGWTLKISDSDSAICYSSGASLRITADTPTADIVEGVQRILQPHLPPVEIDAQADVFAQIDFRRLILTAWAPRFTPLIEGFTADNAELVESICADVRLLALLQKADNLAEVDSICALVKQLS